MFAFSPQPCTSLRLCGVLLALLSLATPFQATAQNIFVGSGEVLETTDGFLADTLSIEGELINNGGILILRKTFNFGGTIRNRDTFIGLGDIDNSFGSITSAGTFESGGGIDNSSGTITNAGTFESANDIDNSRGTIENRGAFQSGGGIDNSSGTITNAGTFESANDIDNSRGTITSAGTFQSGGGIDNSSGTITSAGTFQSGGDINNSSGTITNSGLFASGGDINSSSGVIQNSGTFITGDIDTEGGEIENTGIFQVDGNVTGVDGNFRQTKGTLILEGDMELNTILIEGGTVEVNGGFLKADLSLAFNNTRLSIGNGDRSLLIAGNSGSAESASFAQGSVVDILLDPTEGGVALELNGTLAILDTVTFQIDFVDGTNIEDGDIFDLLTADFISGSFDVADMSNFAFPDIFGIDWSVSIVSDGHVTNRQILRATATASAVAPVPLPAGAWLLGAGLLGLAGLKRRRAPV